MIGRNDPCLCGSGKKYKKCCLGKNELPVEQLVDKELERILLGVYEQEKGRADIAEYTRYRRQWSSKLGNLWNMRSIEIAVTQYFLFIARRDIWQRHLSRVLNSPLRGAVRSIVESWQEPIVLFAKVIGEQDGFIELKEVHGEETYYLKKEEETSIVNDTIVFGVVLPDNRFHEKGLYVITSLLFNKEAMNLVKSNEVEGSIDYYQEHMVDIYQAMLSRDTAPVEELIDKDLTEVQREALKMIAEELESIDAKPEAQERLRNIGITYFIKEQPNFRKPNVVAAAVFLVALDMKMLGELTMTNAEVAKRFDVSAASIKKHAENIHAFVDEMMAQAK